MNFQSDFSQSESQSEIKTVLLDLDGTLLDTAPDFITSLNYLLKKHGKHEIPADKIRQTISHGALALLKLAFGKDFDRSLAHHETIYQAFLEIYQQNMTDLTQPFSGIDKLLITCSNLNICWGVVTNKPRYLTIPLLKNMPFPSEPMCVVAGDDSVNKKPAPDPLLLACKLLNKQPHECLYLGDAECDVIASKKAGMLSIVAEYGYIAPEINSKDWQADGYINCPTELMRWLTPQDNKLCTRQKLSGVRHPLCKGGIL